MNTATITLPEAPRVNGSPAPAAKPVVEIPGTRFQTNGGSDSPAPTSDRKSSRKRIAMFAVLGVVVISAAIFARDWWTVGRFIESTDDAYIGGDVTVIAPKVAGFISELSVGDNQQVHAGDLLLKLDDRDYRAALAKADAAVAIQQASIVNLDAQRNLQAAVIVQARSEIGATDAEIVRTRTDQARYEKLSQTGALSIQEFQRADADYKKAVAAGDKSHAALDAAQRQLEVIATQKQQAEASLAEAGSERELARLNLSYTELRAPIDGTVGNRSAQAGAYATIGSQLISLVPAHGLWIDANYKESQLARMHPGSPAIVRVDSLSGRVFHGHVASIAPATGAQFSVLPPENATGNFTKIVQRVAVRIVLDDEAATLGQLRPGLSVTAKVNGKSGI